MGVREIDTAEARRLIRAGEVRLVDCREEDEHRICRIEGSVLIPLSTFGFTATERLADPECAVLIYCHHGMRSLTAARFLVKRGYSRVMSLAGGIDRWAVEIDPGMPRY